MDNLDKGLEMSMEEFRMIRDYIHEKSGIYFAENKMYVIQNRLARRLAELDIKTVRDYFYHVKYDTTRKEFNHLIDLITTNETSFFRNEPQLTSFAQEVLPLIIEQKTKTPGRKSLRLWSAGCSTGEEPYTLAMLILDTLPSTAGWQIEIIASDISEQVLRVARKGEYHGLTLRNVPPAVLNKHFERAGDNYRVKAAVRSLVQFTQMNLNDERRMSLMRGLDVIFCRNVMIYFSTDVKKQVVKSFYNILNPGGYLFIGHSESLHSISKAFKLVYFKKALVYQKDASRAAAAGAVPKRATAATPSARPRTAGDSRASTSAASGATRALELLRQLQTKNKHMNTVKS